jgi:hypothetical protein
MQDLHPYHASLPVTPITFPDWSDINPVEDCIEKYCILFVGVPPVVKGYIVPAYTPRFGCPVAAATHEYIDDAKNVDSEKFPIHALCVDEKVVYTGQPELAIGPYNEVEIVPPQPVPPPPGHVSEQSLSFSCCVSPKLLPA